MSAKKILLICAGGMSTSLLVNKMREAASMKGLDYEIDAHGLGSVAQYAPESDCILLGPQIRYALKELQKKYPGKPIEGIDMRVYGTMNGKKAIEIVRRLLGDE